MARTKNPNILVLIFPRRTSFRFMEKEVCSKKPKIKKEPQTLVVPSDDENSNKEISYNAHEEDSF